MINSTNPIHTKVNNVFLVEKQAKDALNKEKGRQIKTDFQLRQLGIRSPEVETNFERTFKKLPVEKEELKRLRMEHNKHMRLNGFNPKRRINVSGPQTLKFTA